MKMTNQDILFSLNGMESQSTRQRRQVGSGLFSEGTIYRTLISTGYGIPAHQS